MASINCTFCQIINNEQESKIIFQDKKFMVFLDKRPVFLGHCLLIPKKHISTVYDLPENNVKSFFSLAKKIGKAVEMSMQAEGSLLLINNKVSQSVPHLHLHIIPRKRKDGLRGFLWPRQQYANEKEMLAVQNQIIKSLKLVGNQVTRSSR